MLDLSAWLDQVSAASPLGFALVALAGLTMAIAPSSLPLFSVVAGYVVGQAGDVQFEKTRLRGLWLSLGFVLGMATVDAALGALFGLLGSVVIQILTSYLGLTNFVIAALLVFLGLALLRKIRVTVPVLRPALRHTDSFGAAYVLGIPFGLSTCPACTPMVLPILGAAAATGKPWLGAILLFTFGLARGIPLLLVGAAVGTVSHLHRFAGWIPKIERAGGVLLLLAALYFLYQGSVYEGWLPPLPYLA